MENLRFSIAQVKTGKMKGSHGVLCGQRKRQRKRQGKRGVNKE
jgi:hypothetical protein